jgi:hypothetical protein
MEEDSYPEAGIGTESKEDDEVRAPGIVCR